jgi:hypothetical protein
VFYFVFWGKTYHTIQHLFFFFFFSFLILVLDFSGLVRDCQTHGIQMHWNGVFLGLGRLKSAGREHTAALMVLVPGTSLLCCNNASYFLIDDLHVLCLSFAD